MLMMATADSATVDAATGKVHILGIFRNIYAQSFPFVHKRMCLVITIEGEITDSANPHAVAIALADEDGNEVLAVRGPVEMPTGEGGIAPYCNLLFEMNDLSFEQPGEYCFYVTVNERELESSTAIRVVQVDGLGGE